MATVDYTAFDREIWDRELGAFVPNRIYDMHTHLWSDAHKGELADSSPSLPTEIDYRDHLAWAEKLYPGREIHFLVLGKPRPGIDVEGYNAWIAEQMAADAKSVVNMLVTPDMRADYVSDQVQKHDFFGLKPYRLFAPDPDNARIGDFLPEALIEVAHDQGLAITLHLCKKAGAADPDNLKDLQYYTRQYPRAQFILAHCARAFNVSTLEESIHHLRDLPNIWYDTSAVNDLYSHYLLMKHEDRRRVMFGSDNVDAGCAWGKYITYGKAWVFFGGDGTLSHCNPTPTFVIYEQLRQERQVAEMLALTRQEIEDHFSGNAIRLIQMIKGRA